MKKLFMLLAIAGVMVACGDDKKKDEKKDAQATEAPAPVAEKDAPAASNVDALINKTVAALQSGDEAALGALEAEYNKLSKEDQAKFDAAMNDLMGM